MNTILIACDHAGFELKEFLKKALQAENYTFEDYGTFSRASMDYPDTIHPLAKDINSGKYPLGIIICGTGNGANMVANKYPFVRSALCWCTEIAALARQHNNANIAALPAHFISKETALEIVHVFLATPFEGGRHVCRVDKINSILK